MGQLLAELVVRGTVVPWSAPETFLGGRPGGKRHFVHRKDGRLIAWQDSIRAEVARVRRGDPFVGPVLLSLVFVKSTDDVALWGRRWWQEGPRAGHGDLVNLVKAAEDAIKTWRPRGKRGISLPGLIGDDAQVTGLEAWRWWGRDDRVEIQIYVAD